MTCNWAKNIKTKKKKMKLILILQSLKISLSFYTYKYERPHQKVLKKKTLYLRFYNSRKGAIIDLYPFFY